MKLVTPLPAGSSPLGNNGMAISMGLLLVRLALGFIFFYHGAQKMFGWFDGVGLHKFAGFLALPVLPPMAWAALAAGAEFFGGCLVFIGLFTRVAAFFIMVVMWVAIATVTGVNGFSAPKGYEYNMALIAMAAMLMLGGAGIVSADAYIFRRGLFSRGPNPLNNPAPRAES